MNTNEDRYAAQKAKSLEMVQAAVRALREALPAEIKLFQDSFLDDKETPIVPEEWSCYYHFLAERDGVKISIKFDERAAGGKHSWSYEPSHQFDVVVGKTWAGGRRFPPRKAGIPVAEIAAAVEAQIRLVKEREEAERTRVQKLHATQKAVQAVVERVGATRTCVWTDSVGRIEVTLPKDMTPAQLEALLRYCQGAGL